MSPTITTPAMTQAGMLLGTAAYMSPEQARGTAVDKRADVWAFGVVLWEMLTGKRLFEGATVSDTLAAVLKTEPQWNALAPATPAAVRRLLRRCLEKDRKRRLDSAAAARLEIEDALTAPSTLEGVASRDRLAWSVAVVAALVALILVMPATSYLRRAAAPERNVTRVEITTPTTSDPSSFALSPDGRQLAFIATSDRNAQLWVRSFDDSTARALPGTEGASLPFWAPNGRAIGFFAGGKLKRIDLAGGAPQILADASGARGGAWSPDGVILFGLAQQRPLMRVSATGGAAVAMTEFGAGGFSPRWPQFLPDGRRFLYFAESGPDTLGTYVGSLDGGTPTRVVPDDTAAVYVPPDTLLVVRQGVLMALRFDSIRAVASGEPISVAQGVGSDTTGRSAFAVSVTGVLAYRSGGVQRRQLVWMDRAGNLTGKVGGVDDSALSNPTLTADDQHVAVGRATQGNADIWLVDVARGVASRFTFGPGSENGPVWSPDGRRIVFTSTAPVVYDLFEKSASGAVDEHSLLVTPEPKWPTDWSPDGRTLLYASVSPKTGSDLWGLPLVGDKKPVPVLQTPFDEMNGQFSPDGRWIAYESNESGRVEIYVRPFAAGGGKWQISTAGGSQPRWRPDGKELFYVASDGHLMVAPITVALSGQAIQPGAPETLFVPRLSSGTWISATAYQARSQYAVSRDGRFLMNVAVDEGTTSPINIVLNWDTVLKR